MSIPFLHHTDPFHPHGDPDDHWDLACVYALARAGDHELRWEPAAAPDGPARFMLSSGCATGRTTPRR